MAERKIVEFNRFMRPREWHLDGRLAEESYIITTVRCDDGSFWETDDMNDSWRRLDLPPIPQEVMRDLPDGWKVCFHQWSGVDGKFCSDCEQNLRLRS